LATKLNAYQDAVKIKIQQLQEHFYQLYNNLAITGAQWEHIAECGFNLPPSPDRDLLSDSHVGRSTIRGWTFHKFCNLPKKFVNHFLENSGRLPISIRKRWFVANISHDMRQSIKYCRDDQRYKEDQFHDCTQVLPIQEQIFYRELTVIADQAPDSAQIERG
jgi:hypothetical protein